MDRLGYDVCGNCASFFDVDSSRSMAATCKVNARRNTRGTLSVSYADQVVRTPLYFVRHVQSVTDDEASVYEHFRVSSNARPAWGREFNGADHLDLVMLSYTTRGRTIEHSIPCGTITEVRAFLYMLLQHDVVLACSQSFSVAGGTGFAHFGRRPCVVQENGSILCTCYGDTRNLPPPATRYVQQHLPGPIEAGTPTNILTVRRRP
jgi:hypothetical protein